MLESKISKGKIDKIMKFKSVSVMTSNVDNPPGIIMDEIEGMGSSDMRISEIAGH